MEKNQPKTTPKTDTRSEGVRKRMENITLQSVGNVVRIETDKENVIRAKNEDKRLTTRANYNILETSKLNAMAPAFVPRNYNYTASKRLDHPHKPFQPLEREFIVFNSKRIKNELVNIKHLYDTNKIDMEKAVGEYVTELFGEVQNILDRERNEIRRQLDQQRYMQRMANESLYIKRFQQSYELETQKAAGEHVTYLFGEVQRLLDDEKNEIRRKLDQQRYMQRMANASQYIKRFHQSNKLETQKAVGEHVIDLFGEVQKLLHYEKKEIRRKLDQQRYMQRMENERLHIKRFYQSYELETQKAMGQHVTELFEKVKHIFDAKSSSRNTSVATTLKIEPVGGIAMDDKSMEGSFKVISQHAEKMACKSEVQHSNANVDKLLAEVNIHKTNDVSQTMNENDDHLIAGVFDEIIEDHENPYIRMMCFG